MDILLIGKEDTFLLLSGEDLKETNWNNSSTRSGITNQTSCDKNISNRNKQQMQNVYTIRS